MANQSAIKELWDGFYNSMPGYVAANTVRDVGVSGMKGVVGTGEALVGLGDFLTGGHLGNAMQRRLGYDPKATRRFLNTLYSPAQQAANREVDDAKGIWNTTKAIAKNPSTIAHAGIEATPTMLMGTGIGGKVVPKVGKFLNEAAFGVSPYRTAPAILTNNVAAGIGEGLVNAGATAENQRQHGVFSPIVAALGGGLGGAVVGRLGNRAFARTGLGDLDTAVASNAGKLATGKAALGGMASEGTVENVLQTGLEKASLPVAEAESEARRLAVEGRRKDEEKRRYAINADMLKK